MSTDQAQIQFGETVIAYELTYAARKTLCISVAPDLQVSVIAPTGTDPAEVAARVRKRAAWIIRQQRELERYLPAEPPRQYISGETHRYLGRQYRLKVIEQEQEGVRRTRGRLVICTWYKRDPDRVRQLLDAWYHIQARRIFPERLQAVLPRFRPIGVSEAPPLLIKPLEASWGMCSDAGVITLNLRLIQTAKPAIDYVLIHELCHLIEHNHSPRFYRLLDRMLPDWRERRRQLNELASG